jgi:hypothetical protein
MNRKALLLGGPSINPHWNVPRALHILEGEIVSSLRILEIWEPHLQSRVSGNGEHSHELGMAVSAILITSHAAEMALKSLLAQTCPDENPRKFGGSTGHSLNDLFGNLPHESKLEVEGQFNGMPIEWENYAGREYGKSAEEVFRIADDTFVDWRYAIEDGASNGIPKGVLKAAAAVRITCATKLRLSQVPNSTHEEIASIQDVLVKP